MENHSSNFYSLLKPQTVGIYIYAVDCNLSYLTHSPIFHQAYRGILASLMTTSVILNVTIIVAVCSSKTLHTVPHAFITSLAVSDMITLCWFVITELFQLHDIKFCQLKGSFGCARVFLISFGIISTISNQLMISIERWLYIARPFLHQRIVTRRSTACSLIFVWLSSALINLNMATNNCGLLSVATSVNIGVVSPALHFLLSFLMISIYTHIALLTRRAIRNINKTRPMGVSMEVQGVSKTLASIKSAWKNIRLFVTVFGTFFILMTPEICGDIYAYSTDQNFFYTTAGKILDMLWCTHCCMNFFIYSVQDRAFRDVLMKWFSRICGCLSQRCRKRVHTSNDVC